tara:strand:- start:340 stop:567 length:228 start_codon:yes stop_codon:yes gene_type:complete
MKVIDLHGVRYKDVYGMLEKSCTLEDLPFVVITGRSSSMKKIVSEIVSTFGLEARERLGNEGRMIVCENNRKKFE